MIEKAMRNRQAVLNRAGGFPSHLAERWVRILRCEGNVVVIQDSKRISVPYITLIYRGCVGIAELESDE